MDRRALGRTGHESTIVTLGGAVFIYPIEEKVGDGFVKYALDHGVNHIDVAPTYGDAEVKLGKWVKEYRDDIFLACKTGKRTKSEAIEELRRSLERLQTDHFDLYQFHGLDNPEELKKVTGEDGALRAFEEAREEGLINHIGITSHNPENIMMALGSCELDTVLLPVNYVLSAHSEPRNDYVPVLEKTKELNIGVIAMKSVAKGPYPTEERSRDTWYEPFTNPEEVEEALRFTLSQPVTTATTSSDLEIARMMIHSAEDFEPMGEEEQESLIRRAASYRPLFPRD
ncbi:MAG: aldo/keto reductase [Candidatus Bathyarchaeota archaeon]|nr:MAG: aldo/keto reductase [Candidatus Bathyarchaeota archaeon]